MKAFEKFNEEFVPCSEHAEIESILVWNSQGTARMVWNKEILESFKMYISFLIIFRKDSECKEYKIKIALGIT